MLSLVSTLIYRSRLTGGLECRCYRNDERAPRPGACVERSRVCGGHQDRHVSAQRPRRHAEAAAANPQVPGLPQDSRSGPQQG